jgi:pimeloyl-ACP methyl ester carboxylesterase
MWPTCYPMPPRDNSRIVVCSVVVLAFYVQSLSQNTISGDDLCASRLVCFSGEHLIAMGKCNLTAMDRRQFIQSVLAAYAASLHTHALAQLVTGPESPLTTVRSKDGTLIAVECAGAGPSLVIVHGGTGDRTRWTPLFPLLASRFTVCAMDRRGHGASGDSPHYSLQREVEDVAAVVNSRPGTVFLLGHSYGGVCALEAAFLTNKISKLVLYEPALQNLDNSAVLARMEKMIQEGNRDEALVTFLQEIVMISPSEVIAMKARPSWPGLLATIDSSIRQDRALTAYRFDPKRMSTLRVPTLLLTGSETAAPQLKQAISGLLDSLPNRSLFVFEGQEHNAMDAVPQQFAEVVGNFLLNTKGGTSTKQR